MTKQTSPPLDPSYQGTASDLGFGHLGNGLVVWDRTRTISNDYATVARIDVDRTIVWRKLPLSAAQVAAIQQMAQESDPPISATQSQKVFSTPPSNQS